MKKQTKIFVAALAASVLSACSSFATFDYASVPTPMAKFPEVNFAKKTVAVVPFLDERGTKYYDATQAKQANAHPAGDHGSLYYGFIPLLPAGFVEKEQPEMSPGFVSLDVFQFDVKRDLSDAAFLSLKHSDLFSNVSRAGSVEQANADYVFRGRVTDTYYGGNMYSYCLTYLVSPVFWVLGAPSGTSENHLWIKFELIDTATGNVVWNYDYRGRDYITHWIYARIGKDTSLYAGLMRQGMNEALWELSQKLPTLAK